MATVNHFERSSNVPEQARLQNAKMPNDSINYSFNYIWLSNHLIMSISFFVLARLYSSYSFFVLFHPSSCSAHIQPAINISSAWIRNYVYEVIRRKTTHRIVFRYSSSIIASHQWWGVWVESFSANVIVHKVPFVSSSSKPSQCLLSSIILPWSALSDKVFPQEIMMKIQLAVECWIWSKMWENSCDYWLIFSLIQPSRRGKSLKRFREESILCV